MLQYMFYVDIAQEQKRISVRIEMLLCNYSHFTATTIKSV